MEGLQLIIIGLFFLCCIILVFLIMIQSGKGGSLGIFGGGGSSTPFGTSTTDVITKATWWGGASFFTLAILAAIAFADAGPKIPKNLENLEKQESGMELQKDKESSQPVDAPTATEKNDREE